MATPLIGTGATIVWSGATSAHTDLLDFDWDGINATVLETSTMSTTGGKTYANGSQIDYGTLSARRRFDGAQTIPTIGTTGTVLITWSDGEKLQADNGMLQSYSINAQTEEYVEATLVLKLSGNVSYPT